MINAEPSGPAQVQQISGDDDVVRVRQLVRAAAVATKLSLVDQTKLVTAASELARNTLRHGGGGRAEVQPVSNGRRNGIRITFVDEGPGIPDVDRAFTDGFSTGWRPRPGIVRLAAADGRVRTRHRRRGRHNGDRRQVGAVIMTVSADVRVLVVEPRP